MPSPTDKQFDSLLGISRKMEKSLENIEKSISSGMSSKGNVAANSALSSMSTSINEIVKALSSKDFKKKNADTVIEFISKLSSVTYSIQSKSTEALANLAFGVTKFIDTVSSLSLIGLGKLKLFGTVLFGGKTPLLQTIIAGASRSVNSISESDFKKLSEAGRALKMLSFGLTELASALSVLALVAVISPLVLVGAGVVRLAIGIFISIGKHGRDIEKGGVGIAQLGKGLIMLSMGLATMALLVSVVPLEKYFQIIGVVSGFSLAFAIIGKAGESITNGSKAVNSMGRAMVGLSIGIATLSLVALLVPPKILLLGMLLVAGYGLIFAIIGRAKGEIAGGSLVMILGIALGLFFFSGSLLLLAYTIEKIGIGNAFASLGLIAAYAAFFALIGTQGKLIASGATAVGFIGAGLAVFSIGLISYALALKGVMMLFKNDWKEAALATVGIISGLALLFAGVGLISGPIDAGAGAMSAIGIGIAIFGAGILLYSLALKGVMSIFKNDWKIAAEATAGIIIGLAGVFSIAGVLVVPIALGAASISLIGVSIGIFSVGLILFALSVKAVKAMGLLRQKGEKYDFIGTDIIVSVMKGFSSVALYAIPAMIGVAGAIAVGAGLVTIGIGLAVTAKAIEKIPDTAAFKKKLFDKDTGIISVTFSEFAKIGKQYGFFSMLLGADPASKGARAVKRIGDALGVLAGGIAAFAKVDQFPVQIAGKDGKLVYTNVALDTTLKNLRLVMVGSDNKGGILLTMAKIFGEIGSMQEVTGIPDNANGTPGKGSFFGNLLRRITGDTPMLRGIRAVSQIGDTLQSLAGGITAFANVDEIPVQYADSKGTLIYKNVSLSKTLTNLEKVMIGEDKKGGILLSLAKIFGQIGGMSEVTGIPDNPDGSRGSGSFFGNLLRKITGDTPMIKGIKAVAQIGGTLESLAGGITAFANVDEFPVQIVDPKDSSKLIYKSVKLSDVIENIKTSLIGDGVDSAKPGILLSLANVFGTIGKEYPNGFFDDDNVKAGADAVKEVGDAISGIAQGVIAFAEIEKTGVPLTFDPVTGKPTSFGKLNIETIKSNIIAIVTAMPRAFANLDPTQLEKANENAQKYKDIAEVIGTIGKSVKDSKDVLIPNDKDKSGGLLTQLGTEIENFTTKLAANPVQDSVIISLLKLANVFGRFGNIANPFREFVDAFKSFQDPLAAFSTNIHTFTANFTKFVPQLKNYEKFASLLNSHAMLSKQYTIFVPQFGQMSKDLEVFAKNFKLMDGTAIEAFRIWTEALTNFVKTDPDTFTTIADQLAKVINTPLTVQDVIDVYKGLSKGETPDDTKAPATLTNDEGSRVLNDTGNRRKSEIEILQNQVSQLTGAVNSLVSLLGDQNGIAVRIQN